MSGMYWGAKANELSCSFSSNNLISSGYSVIPPDLVESYFSEWGSVSFVINHDRLTLRKADLDHDDDCWDCTPYDKRYTRLIKSKAKAYLDALSRIKTDPGL